MSNEFEAAAKALGVKSVLDVESHEKPKVRRKRIPKEEVVKEVKKKSKEGGWNLGGVDAGAYKVSAPKGNVWRCKCKDHEITPKTVAIICYRCDSRWDRPEKGGKHVSR